MSPQVFQRVDALQVVEHDLNSTVVQDSRTPQHKEVAYMEDSRAQDETHKAVAAHKGENQELELAWIVMVLDLVLVYAV